MLPLLGILAAGALGQREVLNRSAVQSGEAIKGLLGQAPGEFQADYFPGEEKIPGLQTKGSGLLADPTNAANQLQFAAGIMQLNPRDRAAAAPLFGSLLNQYSQQASAKELQGARLAQDESQFQQRASQINQQFDTQQAYNQQQFAEQSRQFGLEFAQRQYNDRQNQALRWREDARQQAAEARAKAEADRVAALGPMGGVKAPAGYQPAILTGNDGKPTLGVVPMRGHQDWTAAQKEINPLLDARQGVAELYQMMETSGPEMWGETSKKMTLRYGQVLARMGQLREMGVIDQKEYDRLQSQLPDPSAMGTFKPGALAAYEKADEIFKENLDRRGRMYQGFGLDLGGTTYVDQVRERRGAKSKVITNLPANAKPL